eukprot:2073365-Rhodomonas_salina.1
MLAVMVVLAVTAPCSALCLAKKSKWLRPWSASEQRVSESRRFEQDLGSACEEEKGREKGGRKEREGERREGREERGGRKEEGREG